VGTNLYSCDIFGLQSISAKAYQLTHIISYNGECTTMYSLVLVQLLQIFPNDLQTDDIKPIRVDANFDNCCFID